MTRSYNLTQLSDGALLQALTSLFDQDRATTAMLLAHIAEVDVRSLYAAAGYPSMFVYCVEKFHLSEDAACNRIHAARTARQFPQIFEAIAEGRLHLSGVRLLAPHLTPENADELLLLVRYKKKSEIERILTQRFPLASSPRIIQSIRPIPTAPVGVSAPGRIDGGLGLFQESSTGMTAGPATPEPPHPVDERYFLQLTVAKSTHDKLRRAQLLLSHAIPSGNVEQVLDRALDLLLAQLEKRKYAASNQPRQRPPAQTSARSRHIPAQVKRAVWLRDRGQCTFENETGDRCPARKFLEFDHVVPVARGGKATVEGIRLRCRAHNQFEAEKVFGTEYVRGKRRAARARREQHTQKRASG